MSLKQPEKGTGEERMEVNHPNGPWLSKDPNGNVQRGRRQVLKKLDEGKCPDTRYVNETLETIQGRARLRSVSESKREVGVVFLP